MGSSAARDTLLRMMNTRIRLVKIWWWMRVWQAFLNLGSGERAAVRTQDHRVNQESSKAVPQLLPQQLHGHPPPPSPSALAMPLLPTLTGWFG